MIMKPERYNPVLWLGPGQVSYGPFSVVAIDEFEVSPSTVTIIEGANGSGKSSLFKSIAGIQATFTGDVQFYGKLLGSVPAYKRARMGIRFVPQDRRVFKRLTFEQHLGLSGTLSQGKKLADYIEDMVDPREILSLIGSAKKYGSFLSGGEAKIMLLLSAAQNSPQLLMLDEPYAGVSDALHTIVHQIVERCLEEGGACLISDHTESAKAQFKTRQVYEMLSNEETVAPDMVPYRMIPLSEGVK